jgi:hypothetical protein
VSRIETYDLYVAHALRDLFDLLQNQDTKVYAQVLG